MKKYSVSVIVPARDEAGTIAKVVRRVPVMGKGTEIVFVEGFSKDKTWSQIKKWAKTKRQGVVVRAYKQKGEKGKAKAVEIGFARARGEILMILDADLSTPAESLKDFYRALVDKKGEFINGSRFIYPKQKGAMRYFNHLGNKFFAGVFSLILRQRITDTLCGTKAMWAKDYKKIFNITKDIRKDDPYGDFTFLLGAAKMGLKVYEVPVKYKARVYGKSKISPFWDGIKLFKLLAKDFWSYFSQKQKFRRV
jgi:glycosyltransferase involved in cell wall biosynthesis